ncbi:hypothetical protein FRC01_009763 [Tulasnella sp. 417]|nr:hypothetical protein FRC01_009763 [Tulasnella sp. 417]
MQEPEEPLFFWGNSATECESFVNTVNRYAWKSGKSDDSKWIAHFAMSCLSGKALRWAMQLDRNTRKDWDLLSAALLLEYKEDVNNNGPELQSPGIPTPAAAPTATTQLIRGISALNSGSISGRIRVDADNPSLGGYVSRNRSSFGILMTCIKPESAMKVQWTPSSAPHLLQILDPPVPEYNHLGVTHYSNDPAYSLFGPNSTVSAALTCVTKPDAHGCVTSLRRDAEGRLVSGKSRAAIWNVLADLNIIPIIEEAGCQYTMIPFLRVTSKIIMVVANCESYMAKTQSTASTASRLKLVFEPI